MTGDATDAGLEASDGDVQEQRRDPIEDALDPEQTAEASAPEGSSTEADPADVQEQSLEIPEDDEHPGSDLR